MKNLLSISIIALLVTGSCTKNDPALPTDNPTGTNGQYDFAYTNNPKAGDSVQFSAVGTSSTDITWSIGYYVNGYYLEDTLTGTPAKRYFPKQGTFKVNMIVDGDTTKRVSKDVTVKAYDISFLDKDWYWAGIHINWGLSTPSDTTAIDTFMERLIVVDDTTVQFQSSKFNVERVVPQEDKIYFKDITGYYWKKSFYIHKNKCYYFSTGGSNGGTTKYINTVSP